MSFGKGIHKRSYQVEFLDEQIQRNCACQGYYTIQCLYKKHHSKIKMFKLKGSNTIIKLPLLIEITVNLNHSPFSLLTSPIATNNFSTNGSNCPFFPALNYHQSNTKTVQTKLNSTIKNLFLPSQTNNKDPYFHFHHEIALAIKYNK